jgi:hypothetical protein
MPFPSSQNEFRCRVGVIPLRIQLVPLSCIVPKADYPEVSCGCTQFLHFKLWLLVDCFHKYFWQSCY